ncbi:hypothetical protein, partial [Chromobacterium piscinae]|uniref:hypothetical protein n=1 Tax=Chromobacterium piscinae TaxID=686831 RepID=UPI0032613023
LRIAALGGIRKDGGFEIWADRAAGLGQNQGKQREAAPGVPANGGLPPTGGWRIGSGIHSVLLNVQECRAAIIRICGLPRFLSLRGLSWAEQGNEVRMLSGFCPYVYWVDDVVL